MAVTAGADDAGHLSVVDRRRVGLIDDDLPRQAYHAAAALGQEEAEVLVARVDASIAARARAVVKEILAALGDISIVGVAVVGQPREIPDVGVVLASTPWCHCSR